MKPEGIFTAEELASIDAGTYDVKELAEKLDYCIALEREACAKACEENVCHGSTGIHEVDQAITATAKDCAAAIRARSDVS